MPARGTCSLAATVLTAFALLGPGTGALAATVTFSYAGTITTATGIFAGQGSTVTGTFSFDSTLMDAAASDATAAPFTADQYDYYRSDTAPNIPVASAFNMTLSVGTVSRDSANNANSSGTLHHSFFVLDWPESDQFVFTVSGPAIGDDSGVLVLADYDPFPNPDGIAPDSGSLASNINSTIALLSGLDVSRFNNNDGSWQANDPNGVLLGRVSFILTDVSQVPGPATLPLLGTAIALAGFFRRRRGRGQAS